MFQSNCNSFINVSILNTLKEMLLTICMKCHRCCLFSTGKYLLAFAHICVHQTSCRRKVFIESIAGLKIDVWNMNCCLSQMGDCRLRVRGFLG